MKKIAIFIALFSICWVTNGKKVECTKQKINGPEIKFDKLENDFGTSLVVGNQRTCTFTYTNVGNKPLILTDVIPSCHDCTAVEWSNAPVLPGKTGTIKVIYTAKSAGMISKQVTVISNAETDRIVLRLKGKVN